MATEDDSDVPETGAVFTFGKSKFGDNGANKFWIRNDEVVQVSCGDEHTALLAASGRVFMFGANSWGQLGLGHTKTVNKPTRIKALKDEKVTSIGCGRGHTLFATASGRLYSCGANGEGQLGLDDTDVSVTLPQCVSNMPVTTFCMLSCGAEHSAALTDDGKLYVWGGGSEGQLGLGKTSQVNLPTQVHCDSKISCISCGYYHTAFITEKGTLLTFGESDGGKLGHEESPCRLPHLVSDLSDHFVGVSCGGSHTAAVTADGAVYTFGDGSTGQLGHGTTVLSTPTAMSIAWPRKVKVKFVSCGENHTALLTDDGQLYTFGDGRHGKLGLGEESFSNQFHPLPVTRFVNFDVQQVSCGGCHTLVRGRLRARDSGTQSDNSPAVTNALASTFDLSNTISARNRRRERMVDPRNALNRTLPVLNNTISASSLPPLSMTVPPIHPRQPLNTASLDSIKNKERKLASLEQDLNNGDEINKHQLEMNNENEVNNKPRPLPRKPKTDADKSDDFAAAHDDDNNDEEDGENKQQSQPVAAKRTPRVQAKVPDLELAPEVRSHAKLSENEESEESDDEDDGEEHSKHSSKEHNSKGKKNGIKKSADSEEESDHEVKEEKQKTRKKKRNKRGIFQKRRIQHSSTEDDDDEDEEASEIEEEGSEDDRKSSKKAQNKSGADTKNSKKINVSGSDDDDDEKENIKKAKDVSGSEDEKQNSTKQTKKVSSKKEEKTSKKENLINGKKGDKVKSKKANKSDDETEHDADASEQEDNGGDDDEKKNSKNAKKTKKNDKSEKDGDSEGDDEKKSSGKKKKYEEDASGGDSEKDNEDKKNKDKDVDKEEKVEKKSRTCVLL